ncbi:MAG TPA: hypothetical protein EYP17_06805 [Candidatus Latescibacteria bacterium]|nr:hypothetical protein [Candidatus Latescibacterota bacterium]
MSKKLWESLFIALAIWGCVHSKGPPFDDGRIFLIVDEKVDRRLIGHEGAIGIVTEVEGYEPFELYVIDHSSFENPYWVESLRRRGLSRSNTLDLTTNRGKKIEITRRFLPDGTLSEGMLVPGGTEVTVTVRVSPWSHVRVLSRRLRIDGDAVFRLYPASTEEYMPNFVLERVL